MENCFYKDIINNAKLSYYKNLRRFVNRDKKQLINFQINRHEINAKKTCLSSYPLHLVFSSNYSCNLKCGHCPRNLPPKKEFIENLPPNDMEINLEIFERIKYYISYAQKFNLTSLGEPLLYSKLEYILGECRNLNSRNVIITTNGVLLNEKNAQMIVNNNVSYIYLSLDSTDPEILYSMRGDVNPAQISENLKTLNKVKHLKKTDFPKIILCAVLAKKNIDALENLIFYAKENSIDGVCVNVLRDFKQNLNSGDPCCDTALMNEKLNLVIKTAQKNNMHFIISEDTQFIIDRWKMKTDKHYQKHYIKKNLMQHCSLPFSMAIIETNGDVRKCCWSNETLGNLNNNSLEQIWNNHKIRKIREMFYRNKLPFACKNEHCVYNQLEEIQD